MFSNFFKKTPDGKKLFDSGFQLYKSGDFKGAIDLLTKAIDIESKKSQLDPLLLSRIHCIRGEAYLVIGVAILSQSDFAYSLKYNERNESALNNLGVWFATERFITPDYERSLEYFDKALSIKPSRKDIKLNKAWVLLKTGNPSGYEILSELEAEGFEDATKVRDEFAKK